MPALEKAQASGLAKVRDADEPLAQSREPSPASLTCFFEGAWVPPHTYTHRAHSHSRPRPPCSLLWSEPVRPFPSPPWDAVLGTGDLAGSCLYFWH